MILFHCGCRVADEWNGMHFCPNPPKRYTMPRVAKVYRQERPTNEAWKVMTDRDCFEFLASHPDVNAFSANMRVWAWLEQEFGR